jgi:hypothetical protein
MKKYHSQAEAEDHGTKVLQMKKFYLSMLDEVGQAYITWMMRRSI